MTIPTTFVIDVQFDQVMLVFLLMVLIHGRGGTKDKQER
jgi:hypothetical protein